MAFERATPPALRWVLAFLGLCAVLGVWLGFKDQIRRNPPAWYTGAPDPVATGAPAGPGDIREATAFDPNARTPTLQTEAAPVAAKKDAAADADPAEGDADPATAAAATTPPATASAPSNAPAATPAAPPAPRPRPTPPAARPTPSDDPVGDLLDGPRAPPQQPPSDVPY